MCSHSVRLAFPELSNQVIDVKVVCIHKVLGRHYFCYGSCYYVLGKEFKFRLEFPKIIIWSQVSKRSIKKVLWPNKIEKNCIQASPWRLNPAD